MWIVCCIVADWLSLRLFIGLIWFSVVRPWHYGGWCLVVMVGGCFGWVCLDVFGGGL